MKATIRSLNSKQFDENVSSLTIPGINGELEILPGHAKAFFLLRKGELRVKSTSGRTKSIEIEKGICWVDDDVTLLFTPPVKS